jgi:hypothetical protein
MNLALVLPSDIPAMWPFVEAYMQRMIDWEGEITGELEMLSRHLQEGNLQLWIAYSGDGIGAACVTEKVRYFRTPFLSIRWLAGDEPEKWVGQIQGIEDWARHNGYKGLEVWGRTGWSKLLRPYGYREAYRILHKIFSEEHS